MTPVSEGGHRRVLRLCGDIDIGSTLDIRADMEDAIEARATVVRLDLSETRFLDCAGLDALLWCVRRGRRTGVLVELAQPSHAVALVLRATRTRRCFASAS